MSLAEAPATGWMPEWNLLSWVQLLVNIVGVLGNLYMLVMLYNRPMNGRWPTRFFIFQSFYDSAVCLQSAIFSLQPKNWLTSSRIFNYFLCHFWHSQFSYWLTVQLSIGNLVLIGFERYSALVHPLKYDNESTNRTFYIIIFSNIIYNLIIASPNILESKIHQDKCVHEKTNFVDLILFYYAIIWFLMIYLTALILLIIFYSVIIYELKSKKTIVKTSDEVKSSNDRAKNQFTLIAIVITIVYAICISYDAFFYLLGRTKLIRYDYHTFEHQFGEFTVALNSFANPVIYFFFIVRNSCVRHLKEHKNPIYTQRRKKFKKVSRENNKYHTSRNSLNHSLSNSNNLATCYNDAEGRLRDDIHSLNSDHN